MPIAIGILVASGQLPAARLKDVEFAGELGLNGDLRNVRGALAMAIAAAKSGNTIILPQASAEEAVRARSATVLGAKTPGRCVLLPVAINSATPEVSDAPVDFAYPDLLRRQGQSQAKPRLKSPQLDVTAYC